MDPYSELTPVLAEQTLPAPVTPPARAAVLSPGITTVECSAQGPRPENQDRSRVLSFREGALTLAAVADGVTRTDQPALAAEVGIETFCAAFAAAVSAGRTGTPDGVVGVVHEGFRAAQDALFQLSRQRGQSMATTLAVLVVDQEGWVIIGSLGDSRVTRWRGTDGDLTPLTRDQTRVVTVRDPAAPFGPPSRAISSSSPRTGSTGRSRRGRCGARSAAPPPCPRRSTGWRIRRSPRGTATTRPSSVFCMVPGRPRRPPPRCRSPTSRSRPGAASGGVPVGGGAGGAPSSDCA
jgi:hypothetical protein